MGGWVGEWVSRRIGWQVRELVGARVRERGREGGRGVVGGWLSEGGSEKSNGWDLFYILRQVVRKVAHTSLDFNVLVKLACAHTHAYVYICTNTHTHTKRDRQI